MKRPKTGASHSGIDLPRCGIGLALCLLLLAGCGAPVSTATPWPTVPASIPSITATIPPTAVPTQPRPTSTLVPLVTRTRAPTATSAPTRVPGSARCTSYQPTGTEGPAWDIEVAPDGAVWVVAFRGVARLHPIRRAWIAVSVAGDAEAGAGEEQGFDQFRTVTAGPDGTVWLTTRFGDGAFLWDGDSWIQFTQDDGLLSDWVNDISVGPDGAVWFATREGVSRWDGAEDSWTQYSGAGWLQDDLVHRVLFTPDGSIWFAHDDALTRWRPSGAGDEADLWEVTGLEGPLAVRKAHVGPDGRLWLGQTFYDPGEEAWFDTVYREIHLQGLSVDGQGGLWIARSDGAIYIPEPESSPEGEWLHLGKAQGLGADSVTTIALERDEQVWFGTEQGVTQCFLEGLR